MESEEVVRSITAIVNKKLTHEDRAKKLAELLRAAKAYRWVGLYDVMGTEIVNIAWSGPSAPAHIRFPISQGLSSVAVSTGKTVNVGDVKKDSRYLMAFETTQSEIIIPIKDPDSNKVIGTLDVESEKRNAFDESEQNFLEKCGLIIGNSWR